MKNKMAAKLTEKEISKEYHKIWNKYENGQLKEVLSRGFLFLYDKDFSTPDILFVGINLSYSEKDSPLKKSYDQHDLEIPYFKAFRLINTKVGEMLNQTLSWTHLDLLVFRNTSQKYVSDVLLRYEEGIKFIIEQYNVSKQL